MILTKPEVIFEGADKTSNEPIIRLTSADAPLMQDGVTHHCVDLVFANSAALRHFARRMLTAAYAIKQGHFIEPEAAPSKPPKPLAAHYTDVLPDYAEVMTVEDFSASVKQGAFVDDDGHGNPMKGNMIDSRYVVSPSKLHEIPADATHIAWYNK